MTGLETPFYDPAKTYEQNFTEGPFGDLADPEVFQNIGEPTHSFLGFPVYEPFGIPAGPLLNGKYITAALRKGFDIVCYKTQRSTAFPVNDFPNVLYVDPHGDLLPEDQSLIGLPTPPDSLESLSITNSFGNPSRGPEFWVPDLKEALAQEDRGQLIIMSVVGTIQPGFSEDDYFKDFARAAKLAADTGVKAIEINLSCPNVANEGILCYTPEAVEKICHLVKTAIGETPLIAKVGYYTAEQDDLLQTVVEKMAPYVSAISAINTIPAKVVDENGNQALPGPNRLKSGICGHSIKWAGLDLVSRISALRKKLGLTYEIIGVGGIMTPQDYREYREAGADASQSATGAMWNPELAGDIKKAAR